MINRRKRVVIVCDLLQTFLRFRLPLAKEIQRRGHQVHVIASRSDSVAESKLAKIDISVEVLRMDRTGINPFADVFYFRKLRRRMKELHPDLLFTYQAKAAVYSSLAANSIENCERYILFPGLGYLFSDAVSLKNRVIRRLAVFLYRRAFSNIDTAFFQNTDDIGTLKEFQIFQPSVGIVVVNGSGIPLDEFMFHNSPISPVRFTMLTRLLKTKGVYEFANAATALKKMFGERVEFSLVGPVDSNPNALSYSVVAEWHTAGFLTYHGAVEDVRPFLRATSVFVLPSFYMEGTPRSILEAMAVGRAIITTDQRGCRNTVTEGVNGFLVKPQSVDSLKDAMLKFIENPELIQSMGVASRKLAEQKFDVRDVVKQMCDAMNL